MQIASKAGALAGLVVACGGSHGAPLANRGGTAAAPLAPCPGDAALQAELRRRWSVADAVGLSIDACAPGRFGRPGWAIVARTEDEDGLTSERRQLVLGADGSVVVDGPAEPIDFRSDAAPVALQVADLDGDGHDELLEESSHHEAAVDERWLSAVRVAGGRLTELGSLPLGYDSAGTADPAPVTCDSTHELVPVERGLAIVVHATVSLGVPGTRCLSAGTHTFRLVGDHLAPPP